MSNSMRDCAIEIVRRDLLGPGSERLCGYDEEHEIIVTEKVSDRYAIGVLYPQVDHAAPEIEKASDSKDDVSCDGEETESEDELLGSGGHTGSDADYEDIAALSRAYKASAMGVTFYSTDPTGLKVEATAAHYKQIGDILKDHPERVGECGCVLLPLVCDEDVAWIKGKFGAALQDMGISFAQESGCNCIIGTGEVSNETRAWLTDGTFEGAFSGEFLSALQDVDYSADTKYTIEKVFKAYRGVSVGQVDKLSSLDKSHAVEMRRLRALVALYVAANRLHLQRTRGWKRFPLSASYEMSDFDVGSLKPGQGKRKCVQLCEEDGAVCVGVELVIECLYERPGSYRVALSILNRYHNGIEHGEGDLVGEEVFCQPKIVCSGPAVIIPTRDARVLTKCPEDRVLEMLYRKGYCYGRGRGCSLEWEEIKGTGTAVRIETTFLPKKAIKAPDWNVYPKELGDYLSSTAFSAGYLKDKDNKIGVLDALGKFVGNYEAWIQSKRDEIIADPVLRAGEYKDSAASVIKNCECAATRMRKGVETLKNNENAYEAFRLANEAMYRTRQWKEGKSDAKFRWRQFQLGFILVSLTSLVDKQSPDRGMVDLLWFPTGGGKTEAYLGLTAIGIFYRYLTESNPAGTSVIMRYTLRLLASQQFSRACALICACDQIRDESLVLKKKPRITIGLWIGGKSQDNPEGLPNIIGGRDGAGQIIKMLNASKAHKAHPFQPETCPVCGTKIYSVEHRHHSGYDVDDNDFLIHCQNPECVYHRRNSDGMPIQIIDECLYRDPPTLLFGTVDKFAQLSHKDLAARFFGVSNGGRLNPAPDLIIQDELHLISEELGTLVALFETAVDGLCTSLGGNAPKIVASTATVRRAREQCAALFAAKNVSQFPPPGLEASDSYFSKESEAEGRMYLGVQSSGQSTSTTLIRLMALLLFRMNHIDKPEYDFANKDLKELDKYFTLVTYFNSLRELGACETWVNSDISERVKGMAVREALANRMLDPKRTAVMCSRTPSSDIKDMLEELQKENLLTIPQKLYPKDVVLASNMLSVGLDVDRFCLMVMNGQPKKNAEFIQASSRVGRSDIDLGLVITLYSGTKVRDRSYFELFPDYIQSFYKYVEPTTITPFTRAARERLLKPIIATLIRHLVPGYETNDFSDGDVEVLKSRKAQVRAIVERRIDKLIDSGVETPQTKVWTLHEFDHAYDEFVQLAESNIITQYDSATAFTGAPPTDRVLFYSNQKGKAHWEGVSSLRHVDKMVGMELLGTEV